MTRVVSRTFTKDKESDNLNFHDSIFCAENHETLKHQNNTGLSLTSSKILSFSTG